MATRQPRTTVGNKRDIITVQSKESPGLYELKFDGGGEVPDVWKNHKFTTPLEAEKFVQKYLATR